MEDPTIYTLLGAIRDFSNEVTVRALSDKLGVSTSTLMRCKNGRWPRSLKPNAMQSVLDACRDRFFGGDGEALADSVISYYKQQGVSEDTICALERAIEDDGYDEFVSLLINQAVAKKNGQGSGGSLEVAAPVLAHQVPAVAKQESVPASTEEGPVVEERPVADMSAQTAKPSAEVRYRDLIFALPLAVVLLMGLLGFSLTGFFVWAHQNWAAFVGLSVFVALAPALCGVLIDSPFAWRAYKKSHPDAVFSAHAFARVAKYGDPEVVVPGAGRFNLTAIYLFYQPMCNLLSMLCYVAMFTFLAALPEFSGFFLNHEWIELFKLAFVAASLLVYSFCHCLRS